MDETTIDQMKHDAAEQAVAAAAQAAAERARERALLAQRAQLERLEQRAALAENFIGRADGIASLAASQLSQVDPNLRPEILNERRAAITKRALEQVDELRASLHVEAEAARAEAEILGDTRRVLRRARFDPTNPHRDAMIRGAWISRLSRMAPEGLADLALEAAQTADVALLGAIVEELDARPSLATGSVQERAAAMTITQVIASFTPEPVRRARAALATIEKAERELLERRRILAGGRPGGLHQIAEGLRQREQQRRGDH